MSFSLNMQLAPICHKQSEREKMVVCMLLCICSNDFCLTTLMQMYIISMIVE